MTMKTFNIIKFKITSLSVLIFVLSMVLVSCNKVLDVDSNYIIDADNDHLNNATDTMYSATGILKKLQAIGDRTVLLGEARGDLVDLGTGISPDLQEIATFSDVSDDNKYNNPRDYYAVINNCNYYIAKADTALKNSRNQYVFLGEYAAIKAIRAWTYMQLAMAYGEVPFYTEPILNASEADVTKYPRKSLKDICRYFLNEDGLQELANNKEVVYPSYGNKNIWNIPAKLLFIPMNVILGDLALWAADGNDKATYLKAAQFYYNYIIERNGSDYAYPTGTNRSQWMNTEWQVMATSLVSQIPSTETGRFAETITVIPGDSLETWGNYSELPNIFNTNKFNNNKPGLSPSQRLLDISKEQYYCHYYQPRNDWVVTYAPKNLRGNRSGDLRLSTWYSTSENMVDDEGNRYTYQRIRKYVSGETNSGLSQSSNTTIYRRTLIYLRMAEALNRAGYPRFAFEILSTGVNDNVINNVIIPEYPEDAAILTQFKFSTSTQNGYVIWNPESSLQNQNTQGIHSRGSGYTPKNEYYTMPTGTLEEQIEAVEDLIMTEEALEFAFEGYRFYDIMRVSLRRDDPTYLSNVIQARKGLDNSPCLSVDLTDKRRWFLNWNNQIGLGY